MIDHELFHRIADEDCAIVRTKLAESSLAERTSFRNIGVGERDLSSLHALTGSDRVPVLLTPTGVLSGATQILRYLEGYSQNGIS